MILIPGTANGADVWAGTVAHFKARYQCHVVTLAGFAGQPAIGEPFLEKVREGMIRYIRDKKLERPVIVGHSLGGVLGLWIASTIPEEVGPVISVDGFPFIPLRGTLIEARKHGATLSEYYRKLTQEEFAKAVQDLLSKQIRDQKAVEVVARQAIRSDPKAVAQVFSEVPDLRDQVSVIRTPVLMFGQTYQDPDPQEKEKLYRDQVASIPRHKVVMARKAGHYIQLDEPKFFLREVEAFLREAEQNRGTVR
jgi:pimeloyl-ACP methyl ester carboxylesterase